MAERPSVTIIVTTITDDSFPITIRDTDPIAEVKKSIEQAEGTLAKEQLLRYHGRELPDLETAADCGIFYDDAPVRMEPPSIAMLLVGNKGVGKSSCREKFLTPTTTIQETARNASLSPTSPGRASRMLPTQQSPWASEGQTERNAHPESLDHVFKPHKLKGKDGRSVILKLYEDAPDIPDSIDMVDAIAIVFSVTDRASFNGVHMWFEVVRKFASDTVFAMLVATKVDVVDGREVAAATVLGHSALAAVRQLMDWMQVSSDEAQSLANELQMELFEVSSKTGDGITRMFEGMAKPVIQELDKRNQSK